MASCEEKTNSYSDFVAFFNSYTDKKAFIGNTCSFGRSDFVAHFYKNKEEYISIKESIRGKEKEVIVYTNSEIVEKGLRRDSLLSLYSKTFEEYQKIFQQFGIKTFSGVYKENSTIVFFFRNGACLSYSVTNEISPVEIGGYEVKEKIGSRWRLYHKKESD